MDFVNRRQASKILNLSLPQVSNFLTPTKMITNKNGGIGLALYDINDVYNLKAERHMKAENKMKNGVISDLSKADKPSEEYLSLTEAAIFTKLSKKKILDFAPYTLVKGKGEHYRKSFKFFLKEDLKDLKSKIQSKTVGRSVAGLCQKCGVKYYGSNRDKFCPSCSGYIDENDPHGVMIKPKKQNRKCPDCGADLWEEQYKCKACTPRTQDGMDFDEELAYGSINY